MPSDSLCRILDRPPTWADENGNRPADEISDESDVLDITGNARNESGTDDLAVLGELRGPIE